VCGRRRFALVPTPRPLERGDLSRVLIGSMQPLHAISWLRSRRRSGPFLISPVGQFLPPRHHFPLPRPTEQGSGAKCPFSTSRCRTVSVLLTWALRTPPSDKEPAGLTTTIQRTGKLTGDEQPRGIRAGKEVCGEKTCKGNNSTTADELLLKDRLPVHQHCIHCLN
jgi:hypothetical protein